MFNMMNTEKLKKAVKNAGMETIAALWENMETAEARDVMILCERKGFVLSLHNIASILTENESLLWAVYNHAQLAEKLDLQILADR